jgi:threonine dehydratase
MSSHAISMEDVRQARARIAKHVLQTPLLHSPDFSEETGRDVWLKCECMQRTGSFKIRGASNAVWALSEADAARGVVTHSSGNHGQSLAFAARSRGIPAHIVMPWDVSEVKRQAVLQYGGKVYGSGPTNQERNEACQRVQQETGATFVPPSDHPLTMAGQGTIAMDVLDQLPRTGTLIVPVGGGGLIGGIAVAAKALRPEIAVIGAEPALADDAAESKRTGAIAAQRKPVTIADGLRGPLGPVTFPVLRDLVDDIVTVSEDEIVAGMRLAFERARVVIEPSAGVGVAVLRSDAMKRRAQADNARGPTVVVLCGGNANLQALPWMNAVSSAPVAQQRS